MVDWTDEELMVASATRSRCWWRATCHLFASDCGKLIRGAGAAEDLAGPSRLMFVVCAERLHVSAIERLRGAELVANMLQHLFASSAVSELRLEVVP